MSTKDKTVFQNIGFSGFGNGANVAEVDVKDGKIVRIRPVHYDNYFTKDEMNYWTIKARGHEFEPLCKTLLPPFSVTYKKRAYSPNRVPFPLKRVDWDPHGERNPQNRGTSKYERISWDEAASLIADEIDRIHAAYGPLSILCQGDGHGETKSIAGGHGCHTMMFDHIGGYTCQARQPDSWEGWYWGAKHMWGMDPVGQNTSQTNIIKDVSENSDAVLFWGCDAETTPWGWSGQQASRLCYWFTELGIKHIHIAPDVNYTNAVHADKWIPVLPNTDAALQLAIAYMWFTEETYEKEYLESHTVGWDWLRSYVLGYIDGVKKTPEWAAEKCGVPSRQIKALARYWAKHNVSITHSNGGGYIRSVFAHEPARLEISLLAMQGIGLPGRHQFKMIEWNLFGMPFNNPLPETEFVPNTMGCYHGWEMQAPVNFIPKTLIPEAILGGYTSDEPLTWYSHVVAAMPTVDQFLEFRFPLEGNEPIHMIWADNPCWTTCWNGGNKMQDALRDPSIECFVVQHPWMENDTLFADIILPVSTIFESYDFSADVFSGQFCAMYLEEPAIEPVGEAKTDYECVGEVARALEKKGGRYAGLYEKYTKGRTLREDAKAGYEMSGIDAEAHPFEEFEQKKIYVIPTKEGWENSPAGLSGFANDPKNNPVDSPSGLIEIYSSRLAEAWPDDDIRGPYPKWVEESEEHKERKDSARAKDYPYLLVSNHPRWRVHANHDDITWLREIDTCKVTGPDGYKYEPLWINTEDARREGIVDGDIVAIYNERGRVLGGAKVTERIMPGAVYQDHGARVDAITLGYGTGLDRGGANNLIAPSATTSPNCPGEVTNGFLVGVEKVDVFELAKQYPEAFNRPYSDEAGQIASAHIIEEQLEK